MDDILIEEKPIVSLKKFLCMQVCVPKDWTDEQALFFAEQENPCGTEHGWHMRHTGDESLGGCPERVKCDVRPGFVHIMFDA